MALSKLALAGTCGLIRGAAAAALAAPFSASKSLVERYDHALIGQQAEQASSWSSYDQVILIHAICFFAAWRVMAPLAVLIASVGRSWGKIWFRIHWSIQVLIVLPLTVAGGALATYATRLSGNGEWHRHRILGTIVIGLAFVQVGVGYYSTLSSTRDTDEPLATRPASEGHKRSLSRWVHIFLGVTLLTLSGLNITWGFSVYRALRPQITIPIWIQIIHWVLAGIPVLIVGPFIIIRGLLRMKRGQTFAQAYFDRPITPRYAPPRKFFLGGSTYRDAEGGEGHSYERGAGSEGRQLISSGASFNSDMSKFTWEGHSTREEYELGIKASLALGSEYDYAEATFNDDKTSLRTATTAITATPPRPYHTEGQSTSPSAWILGAGGATTRASQPPPLPPYPDHHVEAPAESSSPYQALSPPTAPLRIECSPSNSETTTGSALVTAIAAPPDISVSGASLPDFLPVLLPDMLVSPINVSLPSLDNAANPFPSSPSAPRLSLAQSSYTQPSAILSSISVENSPTDPAAGGTSFSARRGDADAEQEGSLLFASSLESRPSIKSMWASVQESLDEDEREGEEEALVSGTSAEAGEGDGLDEKTKIERAASGRWFGNR